MTKLIVDLARVLSFGAFSDLEAGELGSPVVIHLSPRAAQLDGAA